MTQSILLIILAVLLIIGEFFQPEIRWWFLAINAGTLFFAGATLRTKLRARRRSAAWHHEAAERIFATREWHR